MTMTTAPPARNHRLPVGWGPRRLRHPVPAAVVAVGVGVVATALGAGVAVPHLLENGLTWAGGLALVALVAGLCLLAFAWLVAWRALPGWRRLALLPAVVVALLVIWPLTEGTMLASPPRTGLDAATPAGHGLGFRNVSFRTADGARLSAWWIPSNNRAAVITVPGAGSTRSATLDQAVVLARHGYGVLMTDPRGQGRSGGRAMAAGWYGDADLTAAVAFLQHRAGVDPGRVGVLGLSMGGRRRSVRPPPTAPSARWSPRAPPTAPPRTRPATCPAGSSAPSSGAWTS